MSFKEWLKVKLYNLKQKQQSELSKDVSDPAAPNQFMQPFAYQQYKIIGAAFDFVAEKEMNKKQNLFKEFVYRFSQNIAGLFGFFILIILIILALIIPLTTQDPNLQDINNRQLQMNQTDSNGIYHFFGTDALGRDYWARLWWGLRYSLALAFVVTAINVIVGLTFGILMGQFEWIDKILTFYIKIVSVVPSILILILLTIIISPSFWVIVFALTIFGWIGIANQIRIQIKRAKNYEWVAASKVLGTPIIKILWNYIPVIIPILITQLVFTIPGVILSETSLAFIGLSIDGTPTLGNLISEGQKIFPTFLRYVFIPSFLLILITTSVQLIGSSVEIALKHQR